MIVTSLYINEKQWHDLVQNGMTLECYDNLQRAMTPLVDSANPMSFDCPLAENAVNKVIDDFFIHSVLGNEPTPVKIAVHNALAGLAVQETKPFFDRARRAADARQRIEEAIEAEVRH